MSSLHLLDVSPDVLNLLLNLQVCAVREYATDDGSGFLDLVMVNELTR